VAGEPSVSVRAIETAGFVQSVPVPEKPVSCPAARHARSVIAPTVLAWFEVGSLESPIQFDELKAP
jgi:hypothetical protein